LCTGSLTNVSISASIGSGYVAPAYQWQESLDNGTTYTDIPGANSLNYNFIKTAIGIYKYRMSVADGTNIGLTNCRVASNPVTITIHNIPIVNSSSNSPVCEKQVVNLTASGGINYTWSGPAGFSSNLASPSFIAQNNSGGQYNVSVTDQFGCKNLSSVSIVANPKPAATVSNTKKICEGNNVALQAGGGITYLWSPAAGLSNVNIPNPTASPVDSTIYKVVVTSAK
jgi:hypothetical protein